MRSPVPALGLALAAALLVLAPTREAAAYAWMIRHAYTGCATCHADPSGSGLLTPYGRAQSELLLSTRWGSACEEAETSRFSESLFGVARLPESVLLGGFFRNAYIWNTVDGKLVDRRFLQMRTDLAGQIKLGRVRANASLGVASRDSRRLTQEAWISSNVDGANLVSREHWLGVDFAEDTVLVRGGRIALPFGLRNIEHTSWVRSETRTDLNQNQQHGAAVAYTGGAVRAEGMLLLGNFQLRPDRYRERGFSGHVERAFGEHAAMGISTLVARAASDVNDRATSVRQAHGVFARVSPLRPLVFLVEADALVSSVEGKGTRAGYAGFLQADLEIFQGLHLAGTGEVLERPQEGGRPGAGVWGSVLFFPYSHFETRFDVVRRSGLGSPPTMTFLLQAQVYL